MELELSNRLFEWLLADWAGHGANPVTLFPSLRGVNSAHLAEEFISAMQNAGLSLELIDRFRREKQDRPPQQFPLR